MSTNLTQALESIKSEIRINSEGIGFVSIRGAARLAGVKHNTLTEHFSSGRILGSKLTETLTNKGFNVGVFGTQGIPDMALACILEYYAFDAGKRCTETAEMSFRAFAAIGIRSWIQRSMGYEKISDYEMLKERIDL